MSRDWTPEELQAASKAMQAAGQLSPEKSQSILAHLLIDKFAKVQRSGFFPCPRCGKYRMSDPIRNALSRYANIQVCEVCGMDEAVRDFAVDPIPLREWAIFHNPAIFLKDDVKAE